MGNRFLAAGVPQLTGGDPDLATSFWASPAKARSRWLHVRQPVRDCSRHV